MTLVTVWIKQFFLHLWETGFFNLGMETRLEEEKLWIQTCYTLRKNRPCIASSSYVGVGEYIYIYIQLFRC